MSNLTLHRLQDDNTFEQIGRIEDDEFVDGEDEFASLLPREEWVGRNPRELAREFDGPHVIVTVDGADETPVSDEATDGGVSLSDAGVTHEAMREIASKGDEWVYDEGPQGGDRWRNTETGEYVYYQPSGAEDPPDEDKPSEVPPGVGQPPGSGGDSDDDSGGIPEPEPGDVVDTTDMPPEEIAEITEAGDAATVDTSDRGSIVPDEVEAKVQFIDSDWVEVNWAGQSWTLDTENVEAVEKADELAGGTPAEELEDMETEERLEGAFDHAAEREGFREAGFRGGNTTGDEMEILRYQDGSRDFAIPVDAYPGTTGVVRSPAEAKRHNRQSPRVINELGGTAAKTRVVEDPESGDEYIVKEGLEGGVTSAFTRGEKSLEDEGADPDELAESAERTMAAAYFTGNSDLHGGNLFIDAERNEYAVIDFDSGGYQRGAAAQFGQRQVNDISRYSSPGGLGAGNTVDVYETVYEMAQDIRSGEVDLGRGEIPDYAEDAADMAVRVAYMDPEYDLPDNQVPAGLQFPPSGVESVDDLEDPNDVPDESYPVEFVTDGGHVTTGDLTNITDDGDVIVDGPGFGVTIIDDVNRLTDIL